MTTISTPSAPQAIGPYSQAVKVGNMLFSSGQIALRPDGSFFDGNIKEQTTQVLTNLEAVLTSAGYNFSNVVKTTVFLLNMDDFSAMNEIYAEFFVDNKPARSTVAVKTLPRNALVEIECIAVL